MGRYSRVLHKAHKALLFPCLKPIYENPITLVEGRGVRVLDADGREYLDFFAGILTTSIGHCHDEVVQRIRDQAARLGHVSPLYVNVPQISVARKLAEIAPKGLACSYFTNSGTEAVETAVTLAQLYTGRREILALRLGYSGRSMLATNLTGLAAWRPLSSDIPWVKHVRSPYTYRSDSGGESAERFAQEIEEVIVTSTDGKPAAFFAETIQGAGGCIVPPPRYFRLAAEVVRSYGGLFIADEVQTGFGRTGSKWFGIEHWGVTPDIMVTAKGIANGFPVGATTTRPDIAAAWTARSISTYGGNPLAMAAVSATLDVMRRENTPLRSELRGRQLRRRLEGLRERFRGIGDVRGMGLMQGMELVEDRGTKTPSATKARALLEAAREEGLLLGIGGMHGNVIRIGPSLLVSEEEMATGLDRLERACGRAAV